MPFDARKTVTDAGYVAVGIGVLTVQQLQARGRVLQQRLDQAVSPLTNQADRARGVLKSRVEEAARRAQFAQADVRGRVRPVVAQLEARLAELPQPLNRISEPFGRVRVALAA